ncbi:MAG: hypothetical protein AB7I37_00795 [Pirellulales bacterium]
MLLSKIRYQQNGIVWYAWHPTSCGNDWRMPLPGMMNPVFDEEQAMGKGNNSQKNDKKNKKPKKGAVKTDAKSSLKK